MGFYAKISHIQEGDVDMAAMAAKQEATDELVPGYTFEVYFGNETKVGFSKVSNITHREDVAWIPDGTGGVTPLVTTKKDRHQWWNYIVLERGMSTGKNDEALRKLKPGVHLYDIMIIVLFNDVPVRVFHIEKGIVTQCSFSDMDALRSDVIIRTMEIQHTGIEEVAE